jgi:hypothetical protein
MSENRSDIDINDPNSWKKWAKKADVHTDQDKLKALKLRSILQYQISGCNACEFTQNID